MDGSKFDDLTRRFVISRRGALRLLAGSVLGAAVPAAARSTGSAQRGKIPVCHATGSGSNPWTYIEIPDNGNGPHGGHSGDVIGVDLSSDPNHCGACGNSCDDGDPCTIDTCVGGGCVSTPMDCSGFSDACNLGVCTGGQCGPVPVEDGIGCDDGNACTQNDSCQGGSCAPGSPVTCTAPNQCYLAGDCNPASGCPVAQYKGDGTLCGLPASCDGDNAYSGDSCQDGECSPGTTTVCGAGQDCVNGQCQNTCQEIQESCADDSECCNGVCQDVSGCGAEGQKQCCVGAQAPCSQCDCCDPYTCVGGICCVNTLGGQCDDDQQVCCAGLKCVGNTCQPETCGLPQDGCNSSSDCCQNELTECRVQRCGPDSASIPRCCHPSGRTCGGNCDCCPGLVCLSGTCQEEVTCGSIGQGCVQSQCCGSLVCMGTPDPDNPFDVCVGQVGEPCRSVGRIQPFPGPIFSDRTTDCDVSVGLTCGVDLHCTACGLSDAQCTTAPDGDLANSTCCLGLACIGGTCTS